ncbi:MAG: DUF697 domain-containing protein [Gammaproteobacteria bacterium]|nr:DUF697 domain-containing protein [Gammaproteobacteria bacterium]
MSDWRSKPHAITNPKEEKQKAGDDHLERALESLNELLSDTRIPDEVRDSLSDDYAQVEAMLDKLAHGHLHIAVFGRVSVGKSSILNALLNQERFSTSPLHGETKRAEMAAWETYDVGGIYLIDTPGINEVEGIEREKIAHEVASRSDLILFVVDGDLTDTELQSLRTLATHRRPILLVLNKIDRYTASDKAALLNSLEKRSQPMINPRRHIVCAAAQPATKTIILVNEKNEEIESTRTAPIEITDLKKHLWDILEAEGKTLAALNASLFADDLNEQVTQRVMIARQAIAEKVVRTYCISKGIAVAFNPIPVADLFAAVLIDSTMIVHLSKVYGFPITRNEAQSLVGTIAVQMLALMGTVWAINFISSALKASSAGISTAVTAGAQGAIAYYSTYVVGQVAQRYLAQGKTWGEGGAKRVVREILDSVDRDSIVAQARSDILTHLKT